MADNVWSQQVVKGVPLTRIHGVPETSDHSLVLLTGCGHSLSFSFALTCSVSTKPNAPVSGRRPDEALQIHSKPQAGGGHEHRVVRLSSCEFKSVANASPFPT